MLISTKMRKDLIKKIDVNGAEVSINGNEFVVKMNGKELRRSFDLGRINASFADGVVVLEAKGASKRESKMLGTIEAHLKNMVKGLGEDFVYELEICNVHFPMNVAASGNKITIKSFLGEKTDRVANVLDGVKVNISGSKIIVTSNDIEKAGQTAANLEKAARLTGRDRRIFQDGIFITKKPYKVF